MADDWEDDDYNPPKKVNNFSKPMKSSNDDGWDDDPAPSTSRGNSNTSNGASYKKNNDDDWDDQPSGNQKQNNGKRTFSSTEDDWGDEAPKPKTSRYGFGNDSSKRQDDWGNNSGSTRPAFNGNRGPRKPDWTCDGCNATVFGSRDTCFKCQAPKGDSKDAPNDGSRGGFKRANDWICSECNAKVFGSKDSCFKCQAPKGDSKDAPPDDGSRGSGRPSDWICNSCSAKVFGSRNECFKCQEPKGDAKDAPPDDGSRGSGRKNDWICNGCGVKVFGSRDVCFKCQEPKGDAKDAPSDDNTSGRTDGPRGKKPGDWDCSCGHNNYSSRDKCQKCEEPKPEGVAGNSDAPKEFYIPIDIDENDLFNTGISTGINFEKYDKIPVEVIDTARNQPPKAIESFESSGLNELLLKNVKLSGYKNPTPIQKNAIPITLAKRDLMACAQTGSGKTAAFLLPIIQNLMADQVDMKIGRPYAVIITPTRELTTQIYNEARKFAKGSVIKCNQVFGGTAVRHQCANLNEGCHILVATPGRLLDFARKTYVTFELLRFLVLDEADRMLDMGFKDQLEELMNNPTLTKTGKRQTLMFSATFPEEIRRLAGKHLHENIFLKIGMVGGACTDVVQTIHAVGKYEKRDKLKEILQSGDPKGTMVFVETKRTADFLASFLSEYEVKTTSIHGDRMQRQREEALRDFKMGSMKVLIATSVAARGLDIPNVHHVINYDMPKSIDEYVHRIGRTGRVGNIGKATTFFDSEQDADIASDLKNILKNANQTVPDFLGSGGSSSGNGQTSSVTRTAAPTAHGGGDDDEEW